MIVRCVFARFYHNRLSDSNSMRWCRKLLSRVYGDVHDPNEICRLAGLWESAKHRARYKLIFDTIAQKCKTVSVHFTLKEGKKIQTEKTLLYCLASLSNSEKLKFFTNDTLDTFCSMFICISSIFSIFCNFIYMHACIDWISNKTKITLMQFGWACIENMLFLWIAKIVDRLKCHFLIEYTPFCDSNFALLSSSTVLTMKIMHACISIKWHVTPQRSPYTVTSTNLAHRNVHCTNMIVCVCNEIKKFGDMLLA